MTIWRRISLVLRLKMPFERLASCFISETITVKEFQPLRGTSLQPRWHCWRIPETRITALVSATTEQGFQPILGNSPTVSSLLLPLQGGWVPPGCLAAKPRQTTTMPTLPVVVVWFTGVSHRRFLLRASAMPPTAIIGGGTPCRDHWLLLKPKR